MTELEETPEEVAVRHGVLSAIVDGSETDGARPNKPAPSDSANARAGKVAAELEVQLFWG